MGSPGDWGPGSKVELGPGSKVDLGLTPKVEPGFPRDGVGSASASNCDTRNALEFGDSNWVHWGSRVWGSHHTQHTQHTQHTRTVHTAPTAPLLVLGLSDRGRGGGGGGTLHTLGISRGREQQIPYNHTSRCIFGATTHNGRGKCEGVQS